MREIEKSDYDALHKDYLESVDALQWAIQVLKKQAYGRKQAASLVQVSDLQQLSLIPVAAKRAIGDFLQQDSATEGLAVAAPDAHGYEFKSHGIIEMLEGVLDKFIGVKAAREKSEMNSRHAYDMLRQDLTAQVAQGTQDRELKSEQEATNLQAKANAEGDLNGTTSTRDADQKYLSDLTATCEQKASGVRPGSRCALRRLDRSAIEIISSSSAKDNAEKHYRPWRSAVQLWCPCALLCGPVPVRELPSSSPGGLVG